jgi:hypothetical protein
MKWNKVQQGDKKKEENLAKQRVNKPEVVATVQSG